MPPALAEPPTARRTQPPDPPPPPPPGSFFHPDDLGDASLPGAPTLRLTDYLDLDALQEVQDAFTAVTRLTTEISDAAGVPVTTPSDPQQLQRLGETLDQLLGFSVDDDGTADAAEGTGELVAPIIVAGQELGAIRVLLDERGQTTRDADRRRFAELAMRLGVHESRVGRLVAAAEESFGSHRASAIQFLHLMADSIARLCYDAYQSSQRVQELEALYKLSTVLSATRDLQQVLDTAARTVSEVMRVRAVSIRLLATADGTGSGTGLYRSGTDAELVLRSTHGLSDAFMNKGAIHTADSELFRQALVGETIHIEEMTLDPRVVYPEAAAEEGLASMLIIGLRFQDRPIGTMQLFTTSVRRFTRFEVRLARAIAQLTATAIDQSMMQQERDGNQQMLSQLKLAADVQRRMLPAKMPQLPGVDIAARYVPSYELGGDFYDFINLNYNLGLAIGDVVGKGVAASLMMASVRASLRAYAQDLYDLDEVIARVNVALCRDTLPAEFATLWYGVLNPATLRLTYCNAGHEPPMLLRDGHVYSLDTGGMIVGIDPTQAYQRGIWDLKSGDTLLLYSDGLPDAMDSHGTRYGRKRMQDLMHTLGEKTANDALNHILYELRRYTGLRRADDDTTLVVVKVA